MWEFAQDAVPFLEFYKRRFSESCLCVSLSCLHFTETIFLIFRHLNRQSILRILHLLPSFAQLKDTGLLPRRQATVFAGFLPELSELALIVGKSVTHAAMLQAGGGGEARIGGTGGYLSPQDNLNLVSYLPESGWHETQV